MTLRTTTRWSRSGRRTTARALPPVSNPATPSSTADSTPPTAPLNVVASTTAGSSTVRLTWTAATDPGTPSTGVIRYDIERSSSLAGTYAAVTGSPWTNLTILRFDDATAGWSSTWYYKIYAVDGAGLRGPASTVVSATTGARPDVPAGGHQHDQRQQQDPLRLDPGHERALLQPGRRRPRCDGSGHGGRHRVQGRRGHVDAAGRPLPRVGVEFELLLERDHEAPRRRSLRRQCRQEHHRLTWAST